MSDNAESNDSSNTNQAPADGRPATAAEQEQLSDIISMLRQHNLNVTSIPMNQEGAATSSDKGGDAAGVSAKNATTAGNVIEENAMGFTEAGDGKKKHAFWDTQVRSDMVCVYFVQKK